MKNKQYTFETFLEASSNRFALVACRAVAEYPGDYFNPLCLYGPSGCGKTHLLKAVCHTAAQKGAKAVYITTEEWGHLLIGTAGAGSVTLAELEEADVVAMDTVEDLDGKTATQEELARFFLRKAKQGKQGLLALNGAPVRSAPMLSLLRQQQDALLVDMAAPEETLKIAFARTFLRDYPFPVSEEAIRFLAQNAPSIPRMEGVLQTAHFWNRKYGESIDVDWMREHSDRY